MAKYIPKKVIPTRAPHGHIDVDACVLWCMDPRFRKALWDFEKANKFRHIDVLKYPGGAKALAGNSPCKQIVLSDVKASIKLHNPKVIIPMFHFDCGAYKPLKLGKYSSEEAFLQAEVDKAVKSLKRFGLPVEPVIVDFDKIIVL